MGSIVIQQGREYQHMVDHMTAELGFVRLGLPLRRGASIKGKLALLRATLLDAMQLLRRRRAIGPADDVVVFGHFAAAVKLLARLGLLRYRRLFCFGFFIHSPSWFRLFRLLARLDSVRDHYVVFSESELALYAERLGIEPGRLHFLPYGDWSRAAPADPAGSCTVAEDGGYYFAGGYSNRDYRPLIEAFRHSSQRLLIACSRLNADVDEATLPPNIKVMRDIPGDIFESYARDAKACIIPLKRDTGASGQSTLLRLMRNGKIILASDMGAVRPYVVDGVSGYLLRDMAAELPGLIARIEGDPVAAARLGAAAYDRYQSHFSAPAVAGALRRILA